MTCFYLKECGDFMKQNNSIWKKSLISALFFLILVVILFYFIFKENDIKTIYLILKSMKKFYLFLAFICMACFSLFEAYCEREALKILYGKIPFINAYKYALAGFFVSSITPSSTGGDPMQLYLMTKDKIPVSKGGLALLIKMLAFQFASICISLICFITGYKYFNLTLGNLKYLIYLGIFVNFLVFVLYFLIIFCKPIINFLVKLVEKFLKKIHYKKTDSFIKKASVQLDEYGKASDYLKENKKVFVKIFAVTICQMLIYYSIPYFVYRSLGFSEVTVFSFIQIQSVLYISVSSLPFPGAVGISELTFMKLYKSLFPELILGSAMIVTRFLNFYFFVFYSGIVVFYLMLKHNMNEKK